MLNTFNGNYWDKYEGYDLNRNKIGDVPYHPVSIYSMIIDNNPSALMLFRSFIVSLLDKSEKLIPTVTPENLKDDYPFMYTFTTMIVAKNITKKFGKLFALNDVICHLQKGECIALIGPNGSGKTTFIKCILGMVVPDSGSIHFNNNSIAHSWLYRNQIGYMPQIGRYPGKYDY